MDAGYGGAGGRSAGDDGDGHHHQQPWPPQQPPPQQQQQQQQPRPQLQAQLSQRQRSAAAAAAEAAREHHQPASRLTTRSTMSFRTTASDQQQQQQQEQQQQQQQQEEEEAAAVEEEEEEAPARFIRARLSRPPVARGALHHLAKVFGVKLRGDAPTNEVTTAKYTLLTFLPVNLFEQFLRAANLYFLVTAILQLIPGLSPTSWFTTVAPLVFVLTVNAVKEGYDDVQRSRNDRQVNGRGVLQLTAAGERRVLWKDVLEGDLLRVRDGEEVPADLLLLSTPEADNVAYVETANLDGETNLKVKYAWPSRFAGRRRPQDFEALVDECVVGCEAPNPRLYVFDGFVQSPDGKSPVDINNLLLRGSVLRKTGWAVGLAVNVGSDTKIVQNMTRAPRKVTQLERNMNVLVWVQFATLVAFSAVLAGLDQWWARRNQPPRLWYLATTGVWPEPRPGGLAWLVAFLRFIILLSNMIPISLYVTLEVVKVFQCVLLLNPDRLMYHKESDTPFQCRTTALNEELGQVEYVLSDKTGTLTQNVMGFVWASAGGRLYGEAPSEELKPPCVPQGTAHTIALDATAQRALGMLAPSASSAGAVAGGGGGVNGDGGANGGGAGGIGGGDGAVVPDPDLARLLTALALCNNVVPTQRADGSTEYQASSPDEEALVEGSAFLGYKLVARSAEAARVRLAGSGGSSGGGNGGDSGGGAAEAYQTLAQLEFSSDRKRMSVIARAPDGRVLLLCKGADSVLLQRLAPGQDEAVARVKEHLDKMASTGYRTLLVGQRELSEREYIEWEAAYAAAQVAMADREARMVAEQDRVERGLTLVGATAVEDKLQDGVPECLQALAAAGVKVWVLTGDKVETAITIAHSCQLFTAGMPLVEFREREVEEAEDADDLPAMRRVLQQKLADVRAANERARPEPGHSCVGIVIEGGALHAALRPELQAELMALCRECKAVVCCRVSPMQKAQVTHMVKKRAGAVTLAIGDGANDVGMIRAAHIGVGISGREGRAAVLASDFSFAQFRFLARLLLLHGRWSYARNREVVLYSFYKNWAYVLVYVFLQFVAGFSAVPIFTTMMISTFNMIFTACPIVAYAVLEQDLRPATVMRHPETYATTRRETRAAFFWKFAAWMLAGTWHALPVYFLPWYTLTTPGARGLTADLWSVGTAVFVALTLAVALKLCLRTHAWSWVTHLVYWLSVALLFPFIWVLSVLWPRTPISGVSDMAGVGEVLFTSPVFWLAAVLAAPALALLPDIALLLFRRQLRPDVVTLLQERELMASLREIVLNRQKRGGGGKAGGKAGGAAGGADGGGAGIGGGGGAAAGGGGGVVGGIFDPNAAVRDLQQQQQQQQQQDGGGERRGGGDGGAVVGGASPGSASRRRHQVPHQPPPHHQQQQQQSPSKAASGGGVLAALGRRSRSRSPAPAAARAAAAAGRMTAGAADDNEVEACSFSSDDNGGQGNNSDGGGSVDSYLDMAPPNNVGGRGGGARRRGGSSSKSWRWRRRRRRRARYSGGGLR